MLPLILVLFLIQPKNIKKNSAKILLVIIIGVVIALRFIDIDLIFRIVFNKMGVENASRDSRFASIPANLSMMLLNPLTGKGWTFAEQNFQVFAEKYYTLGLHNTNTIFKMLAVHGVIYVMIVLRYLFKFWIKNSDSIITGVIATIIVCIILSNEDMMVNPLIYIFVFYSIEQKEDVTNEIVKY